MGRTGCAPASQPADAEHWHRAKCVQPRYRQLPDCLATPAAGEREEGRDHEERQCEKEEDGDAHR